MFITKENKIFEGVVEGGGGGAEGAWLFFSSGGRGVLCKAYCYGNI